jgi:ABC-type antimicrobial peptide transport system permease subunit
VGVVAGVVVGIAGALLLSSVIATQLFQMSATDPRVYVAVVSFVAIVAAIACWAPTRRAVRVNPVAALRAE